VGSSNYVPVAGYNNNNGVSFGSWTPTSGANLTPVYAPNTEAQWNNTLNQEIADAQQGNLQYKWDSALYVTGMGLNVGGFLSSAGEYSNVINGSWKGINGKWNSIKWGGNGATGSRTIALGKARYFKAASKSFFAVGTGISLYQGYGAYKNGDYSGAAKSGLDVGMGAFATFGGPPGWIIGGGYFALDALGAFDLHYISTPNLPNMIEACDNTYVSPHIFRPRP